MKKIFTTLVAGLMISAQMMAVSPKDVCGKFNGMLNIDWEEYPGRSVYLLPGATDNTLTFVLPDFTFGKGQLGNIVLPNITMDADGKLSLEATTLYLDSISLRASIKMLNNYVDEGETYNSIVSANSAEVTLEIAAPTLPLPIIVYFQGDAVKDNNYVLPNGGFEGGWTNYEPAGWHSFASACGLLADFVSSDTAKFVQSTDVRPGSNGTNSALITSSLLFGVKANGNCTNGRINAGSMVADDAEGNYNFSDPDSVGFNTPFNGRPDSLVFWTKYLPADRDVNNEVNKARMSTIITTNARYQDPESGDKFAQAKIAAATLNFSAAADLGWQRLAVPFDYTDAADKEPAYILATFTTNQVPGGGSSKTEGKGSDKVTLLDSVYLDDVELVYNRELTTFSIDKAPLAFAENVATVQSNYCDSCAKYAADANGVSAETFIAFDPKHRCIFVYVIADDYAQSGAYSIYRVEFTDTDTSDLPDGIEEVSNDQLQTTNYQKLLINGKLYIVSGDAMFDVLGNRVK